MEGEESFIIPANTVVKILENPQSEETLCNMNKAHTCIMELTSTHNPPTLEPHWRLHPLSCSGSFTLLITLLAFFSSFPQDQQPLSAVKAALCHTSSYLNRHGFTGALGI